MSGLLFLTQDDFYIGKGTKGDLLCNSIKGISLVFFYSTRCSYCQNFIPIYKTLPSNIKGCHFAMINVSQNPGVVNMSKQTICEIKYVPYIILYVNGKPYIQYNGAYNAEEVGEFIIEMTTKLNTKEKFVNSEKIKVTEKSIPAYSTGSPYTDRISYLTFLEAYNKN
jgi:thioredoxin-like negative regulator of GroEL